LPKKKKKGKGNGLDDREDEEDELKGKDDVAGKWGSAVSSVSSAL
jgi:hypothetical protein